MKFGKSIGSQQEGHADLHYIEYKLLKKRIKDVVSRLQTSQLSEALTANTGFEEELAAEINKVNSCFAKRQQELLNRTAAISEELQERKFGGAQESDGGGRGARPPSRAEALQQLVDVLQQVDQLRKYAVWNAVAVVKILKKRRKQTSFGIEDVAAERAGWLSRQSFFSGSDFAELHASIESLGHMLVLSEIVPEGAGGDSKLLRPQAQSIQEPQQCPICLDTISDMVELSCNHRFCWKCFVLGPIAFQPGEYRITQCPICRCETSSQGRAALTAGSTTEQAQVAGHGVEVCLPVGGAQSPSAEGVLSRFLHTYFPREVLRSSVGGQGGASKDGMRLDEEDEVGESIGDLVKVLLADCTTLQKQPAASSSSAGPSDFFDTLPKGPTQDKELGAAQKLQWLQLASTGDPFALDDNMFCALCSEPLMMEAVVTTPCKHHFHRVCISRIDMPSCPLCATNLPFSWFLPADHPCAEHGFRAVGPHDYRPMFPGGPSKGSCGYPLRRPPPDTLVGLKGLKMRSYLHRLIPTGMDVGVEEEDDVATAPTSPEIRASPDPEDAADVSESSSEESEDDDDEDDDGEEVSAFDAAKKNSWRTARTGEKPALVFAWSAVGRVTLLDAPKKRQPDPESADKLEDRVTNPQQLASQAARSTPKEARPRGASNAQPQVLNLGDYLP